jgi:hypothetical protein
LTSFQCFINHGFHHHYGNDTTYLVDIVPVPFTTAHHQKQNKVAFWMVDSVMQRYWSVKDGFRASTSNSNINLQDNDNEALTYGEVTSLGCRQLAYAMNIIHDDDVDDGSKNHSKDKDKDNDDVVFVDLGSGMGRLVAQMYLDHFPTRIHKAIGVELSQERHDIGWKALQGILHFLSGDTSFVEQRLQQEDDVVVAKKKTENDIDQIEMSTMAMTPLDSTIELIHGDAVNFLQSTNESITHVYMSSLCFPEHVLLQLQHMLLEMPSIKMVAALNRLDLFVKSSSSLWRETEVPIQMTWGAGIVKIYQQSQHS